jgi:hypothetical protein
MKNVCWWWWVVNRSKAGRKGRVMFWSLSDCLHYNFKWQTTDVAKSYILVVRASGAWDARMICVGCAHHAQCRWILRGARQIPRILCHANVVRIPRATFAWEVRAVARVPYAHPAGISRTKLYYFCHSIHVCGNDNKGNLKYP